MIITLECEDKNSNKNGRKSKGVFRYTTEKNRKNTPGRIELKKYCPKSNCHKVFREIK